jgi:hypothetical protein
MQTRNAAKVLPLPVGAEIRVVLPVIMLGQPWVWGSVGLPNFLRNHSAVTGCAHSRALCAHWSSSKCSGRVAMQYCSLHLRGLFADQIVGFWIDDLP